MVSFQEPKLERPNGQIFTFPEEFIEQDDEKYDVGPSKLRTPASGPMANIGNDFQGVSKRIVVSGTFYRVEPNKPSVITGSGAPTIRDPILMKYWLESLADGTQTPVKWSSYLSEYSLQSGGGTTTIDGKSIPGQFTKTEGYIDGLGFGEKDNPDRISFNFTIWVADS